MGWGGDRLCQTRLIPRSPDGDNNSFQRNQVVAHLQKVQFSMVQKKFKGIWNGDTLFHFNRNPRFTNKLMPILLYDISNFTLWYINRLLMIGYQTGGMQDRLRQWMRPALWDLLLLRAWGRGQTFWKLDFVKVYKFNLGERSDFLKVYTFKLLNDKSKW